MTKKIYAARVQKELKTYCFQLHGMRNSVKRLKNRNSCSRCGTIIMPQGKSQHLEVHTIMRFMLCRFLPGLEKLDKLAAKEFFSEYGPLLYEDKNVSYFFFWLHARGKSFTVQNLNAQ